MTNHLAQSTSPYLLQHARNPVDWYPWGREALEKARLEDKPIFLSIGYAACHWCHVMAHESFENPEIASILNSNYINIKVDREERPDLDNIYMSAVIALTGQGGWPMSVFLTPELQPFYGGTYFPPEPRHGLPSFKEILLALAEAWNLKREEVIQAGQQVTAHLIEQVHVNEAPNGFAPERLTEAAATLIQQYDWRFGGWGEAPKFPQAMALEFLMRRQLIGDPEAIKLVTHALQAMARGGMYDVVGGGFSRYSTDAQWFIPHFEKMLYDNAQLSRAYLHAWQLTQEPFFLQVIEETLRFVSQEMLSPEGGFYSSLDADSEGREGKFYSWTQEEIRRVFGKKDDFFEAAYGITPEGNWEGKTTLRRVVDDASLAARFGLTSSEVTYRLKDSHKLLLAARNRRVRPGTDDKILTSWNGLMLATFAEAARVLGNDEYLQIARRNADFILTSLHPDGQLRRIWRKGQVGKEVFLEDYAALILGLLELYQTDFDNRWYKEAYGLAEEMIRRFRDPSGGFFDTPSDAEIVLNRPKELRDNATPCGNSLATEALLKLAALAENEPFRQIADETLGLAARLAPQYPIVYSRWLSAADFSLSKVKQVAILGELTDPQTQELLAEIRKSYYPNIVVAVSSLPLPRDVPALLAGRPMIMETPTVYVCEGFVCQKPVTNPEELKVLLTE